MSKIHYGKGFGDHIEVNTLSDELRFVECMKLYKTHETLEELQNALKRKAKEKIRLIF